MPKNIDEYCVAIKTFFFYDVNGYVPEGHHTIWQVAETEGSIAAASGGERVAIDLRSSDERKSAVSILRRICRQISVFPSIFLHDNSIFPEELARLSLDGFRM